MVTVDTLIERNKKMAILFMLAVECGSNEEIANSIVEHFLQVRWALSDGSPMYFTSEPCHIWRRGGVIWCSVLPDGVSYTGETQRITTSSLRVEVAKRVYAELRQLSGYRFAVVGWEVSDCDWDSIAKGKDDLALLPLGLVLSDDSWNQLGRLHGFERFGPSSVWKPLSEQDYLELVKSWGDD